MMVRVWLDSAPDTNINIILSFSSSTSGATLSVTQLSFTDGKTEDFFTITVSESVEATSGTVLI